MQTIAASTALQGPQLARPSDPRGSSTVRDTKTTGLPFGRLTPTGI